MSQKEASSWWIDILKVVGVTLLPRWIVSMKLYNEILYECEELST